MTFGKVKKRDQLFPSGGAPTSCLLPQSHSGGYCGRVVPLLSAPLKAMYGKWDYPVVTFSYWEFSPQRPMVMVSKLSVDGSSNVPGSGVLPSGGQRDLVAHFHMTAQMLHKEQGLTKLWF